MVIRRHLRWPIEFVHTMRLAGDLRSFRVLRGLLRGSRTAEGRDGIVRVALKPLGGRTVALRPGTSDADVLWETFMGRYHLPPAALDAASALVIWDLGSNIGLTIAHFCTLYPHARIVGVELDPHNASLCRSNVAPWADRCRLIEAAVWPRDGEVGFHAERGLEHGVRATGESGFGGARVRAMSLESLLREHRGAVDYVKMDIEGAEREVLRENTGWARHVRAIKVEVHDPYSVEDCAADLRALGFRVAIDDRHWACVIGVREPSAELPPYASPSRA